MTAKQNNVLKKVFGYNKMKALLIVLSVTPFLSLASSQQETNILNFNGISLISFSNNNTGNDIVNMNISGNESQNPVVVDSNSLTVYANRHGSEQVVTWVQNQMNGVPWTLQQMTTFWSGQADATPSELNFAVQGNLQFKYQGETYTCNNIIFAQGHYSTSNNWWVFSNQTNSQSLVSQALEICQNSQGSSQSFYFGFNSSSGTTDDHTIAVTTTADIAAAGTK
jgi:hypothetical protein